MSDEVGNIDWSGAFVKLLSTAAEQYSPQVNAVIEQIISTLPKPAPSTASGEYPWAGGYGRGETVGMDPDIPNPHHFRTMFDGRVLKTGCIASTPMQLTKAHYVGKRMRDTHSLKALPPPPLNLDNGLKAMDRHMALNDTYGDCVVASEQRYKNVISTCSGVAEIVIPDANIKKWYFAATGGRDTGLNIGDALDRMGIIGLVDAAGTAHTIGKNCKGAIDYTSRLEIMLAIQEFKSIKIGVDASPLQRVVQNGDGWFLTNSGRHASIDHCIECSGYGTADYFAQYYNTSVPNGVDKTTWGLFLYTWASVGFADFASATNMTGEMWIRKTDPDRGDSAIWTPESDSAYNDTVHGNLLPTPVPVPVPTPPGPGPVIPSDLLTDLIALYQKAPTETVALMNAARTAVGLSV